MHWGEALGSPQAQSQDGFVGHSKEFAFCLEHSDTHCDTLEVRMEPLLQPRFTHPASYGFCSALLGNSDSYRASGRLGTGVPSVLRFLHGVKFSL